MSYSVSWGYCAESGATVPTLDAAIIVALTVWHEYGGKMPRMSVPPRIANDDRVDGDWDGERYRFFDGLDDDERERLEMAGL
jgi:hypothetical protein